MSTHDRNAVRANVMRMPRLRMTFRQCMLAGFLLIAALLSVAALRSWLLLEQHVERSRIKELADCFPDLAEQLLAINVRMVDLLPIAREHYYHLEMRGSWSLKAVLQHLRMLR